MEHQDTMKEKHKKPFKIPAKLLILPLVLSVDEQRAVAEFPGWFLYVHSIADDSEGLTGAEEKGMAHRRAWQIPRCWSLGSPPLLTPHQTTLSIQPLSQLLYKRRKALFKFLFLPSIALYIENKDQHIFPPNWEGEIFLKGRKIPLRKMPAQAYLFY